jgi:hypothetical protein
VLVGAKCILRDINKDLQAVYKAGSPLSYLHESTNVNTNTNLPPGSAMHLA